MTKLIEKAVSRLQTYEDALTGKLKLDDSQDDKLIQFTSMHKNIARKATSIIASLRYELNYNASLHKANITAGQILLWLNTALNFSFEFGENAKRLYLLPFNGKALLYFGFEAYKEVIQKQFGVNIAVEVFSKEEIKNYYELVEPDKDSRLWDIPDNIPTGCQTPAKTIHDIWGFKIEQVSCKTREIIRTKKYKADKAILSAKYIEQTKDKPMWKTWTYEMARKRAVIFHIKDEFVLTGQDNLMLDMMNFELNQERSVGLAN